MAENLGNGLPDEGQSPEPGHRMAAEGMPFPWRWNGGMISTNLEGIWGMSVELVWQSLSFANGLGDIGSDSRFQTATGIITAKVRFGSRLCENDYKTSRATKRRGLLDRFSGFGDLRGRNGSTGREVNSERRSVPIWAQTKPTRAYAALIAAISGAIPMMLMTRLRL